MKPSKQPTAEDPSYLALEPWDIERWQNSRAFRRMDLAAQGAYRNLCDAAWKAQPTCRLPLDDRDLWTMSGARSLEVWLAVKAEVLDSDAWAFLTPSGQPSQEASEYPSILLNEVVLETYLESAARHRNAVRAGRVAGKASARARRALSQAKAGQQLRTTVQRSFNDRSTIVNPPSPSPSPSPSKDSLSISLTRSPNDQPADAGERDTATSATAHGPALEALCLRQAQLAGRTPGRGLEAAFVRLLDDGRTPDEVGRVLDAYHGQATEAAIFARQGKPGHKGGPGLLWALKAGDAGGFDRILTQLDEDDLVQALEVPENGNGHHGQAVPRGTPEDPPSRPTARLIWERVLAAAEGQVPRQTFATWWRSTEGWSFEDGVLVVVAPSEAHARWIPENAAPRVAAALELCGLSHEVRFIAHEEG